MKDTRGKKATRVLAGLFAGILGIAGSFRMITPMRQY